MHESNPRYACDQYLGMTLGVSNPKTQTQNSVVFHILAFFCCIMTGHWCEAMTIEGNIITTDSFVFYTNNMSFKLLRCSSLHITYKTYGLIGVYSASFEPKYWKQYWTTKTTQVKCLIIIAIQNECKCEPNTRPKCKMLPIWIEKSCGWTSTLVPVSLRPINHKRRTCNCYLPMRPLYKPSNIPACHTENTNNIVMTLVVAKAT